MEILRYEQNYQEVIGYIQVRYLAIYQQPNYWYYKIIIIFLYCLNKVLALEQAEKSSVISPQLRIASSVGNAVLNSPAGADISGHVLSAGPNKITPGDTGTLDNPQRFGTELWSNEYHTYQLEWRKNRIVTRVDDIEYGSFVTGSTFDKPVKKFLFIVYLFL